MISVSTGWRATVIHDGGRLLDVMRASGAKALELGYHVRQSTFEQMSSLIKREGMEITSVHNFFPAPDDIADGEENGELYLFTSDDPDERKLAIKYTVRAMEIAHDLGAKAVVLHLGHIPMVDPTLKLKEYYDRGEMDGDKATRLIEGALEERSLLAPLYLDNVLFCLEDLNKLAERLEIYMGIENRYHLSEVPNSEDFRVIFSEFPIDSRVRYWHDVGHARVNTNLRFDDGDALLEAHAGRMAGIHLHDVKDGHKDHQVPGTGEVDWEAVKSHLTPETIKVLELAPGSPYNEVPDGLAFLESIGL
ncbi:MAG: sugar phosphate isomerase/epimerase [Chloroflexi bacterium]|nr:sugar phosphate isomerase/epimerase [Chloroflexota bacterium]